MKDDFFSLEKEIRRIDQKLGIQFSVNSITGFPKETRKLAFDTIELNKHIDADNANIYTFAPFHGTPLRVLTEKLGLISHEAITKCLTDTPQVEMPQYTPDEIEGIKRTFVLYIKFPKSRWKDIEKAEKFTEEGNKIYKELRLEFLEKYMPKTDSSPISDVNDEVIVPDNSLDSGIEKNLYQDEL